MDARLLKFTCWAPFLLSLGTTTGWGASDRTQNFLVTSNGDKLAQEVATAAERYRHQLALDWLGHELPPWRSSCPIRVYARPQMAAGGATSFGFHRGKPMGWSMQIQGSRERILDSVLPHEILHTVFATHFGQPLPRWADEGACTTVEHQSEQAKQRDLLTRFLSTRPSRGIAFDQMFPMREYPRDILPLYAQGYSVTQFLLARGGKRKFVQFVESGLQKQNWETALSQFYGFDHLSDLQVTWNRELQTHLDQFLATNSVPTSSVAAVSTTEQASALPVTTVQPASSFPASRKTISPERSTAETSWRSIDPKHIANLEANIRDNIAFTRSTVQSAKQEFNSSIDSAPLHHPPGQDPVDGANSSRPTAIATRAPLPGTATGWYARRAAAARLKHTRESRPHWQPIRISGSPTWR